MPILTITVRCDSPRPLKQWVAEEAMREGRCLNAIWRRILYGKRIRYRGLKLKRLNKRVVMVMASNQAKQV